MGTKLHGFAVSDPSVSKPAGSGRTDTSPDADVAAADRNPFDDDQIDQGLSSPTAAAKRREQALVGSEDLDPVRVLVGGVEMACLVEVQIAEFVGRVF